MPKKKEDTAAAAPDAKQAAQPSKKGRRQADPGAEQGSKTSRRATTEATPTPTRARRGRKTAPEVPGVSGAVPNEPMTTDAPVGPNTAEAVTTSQDVPAESTDTGRAKRTRRAAQPKAAQPKASQPEAAELQTGDAPSEQAPSESAGTPDADDRAETVVAAASEPTPSPTRTSTRRGGRRKSAAPTESPDVATASVNAEVVTLTSDDLPEDRVAEAQVTPAAADPVAVSTDTTSTDTADEAPALATPPARTGRGGRRTKASSAPAAEPAAQEVSADQPAAEAPKVTRPKRPRGGRRAATEAQTGADADLQAAEPTPESLEARPEAEPTPETITDTAPKSGRRGGRRKNAASPSAEAAQPEETPVLSSADVPTEPVQNVSRNQRPKKGRRAETPALPTEPSRPDGPTQPEAVTSSVTVEEDATPTDERGMLLDLLRRVGRPLHVRDLERQVPRRAREMFAARGDIERSLERLVTTGDVVRTRKRTYGLPEAMNLIRGRFQATSGGFGFVIPEGGGDDYYIPPESTLEAWNGDTVLVRPEGRGDGGRDGRRGRDSSPRATVVRIVQRHHGSLVGTLEYSKGYAILKADDTRARHRILLVPDGTEDVGSGARVIAQLFWPENTGEDEVFGRVTKVLGETDDPETETQAVIFKYELQAEFSEAALAEAEAIPARIPDDVIAGRLDLRSEHIFTVDGRDAKDFDDAIHIRPGENGTFLIGVHIADVSHYVRPGTALDEEAYARATSVYLPGRVLPMLPERLSNGVCSLVPNEDRLTLSALVTVSADGDVQDVQMVESVIRSQARLTYDEVQAYSEGVATLPDHARKVEGDLHLLLKLTTRMRQRRLREGSLDFKLREVKVDVDKEGNLQLIPIREETARGMIEDLMLLANKVVARQLLERNAPALYRVHEDPTPGRFAEVSAAMAKMGIALGTEPTPQAYQAALKQVRGTPQETAVNTLLLRSLKQARYAEENLGHFGLAFEEYLHFTSPIRRYPDLIVHRAVRAVIEERTGSREMQELREALPKMGEHTSERERAAAEAERDLTKYYQAKWAQAHLGETFDGTVSGVTSFGLFVALENGVEGLLHISNLDDDYYFFIEDAQMLKGRTSGQTFRVGDAVTITIAQVNPIGRQIDFSQETDMTDNGKGPRARKRGERDQVRAETREPRMNERPAKLAALDAQGSESGGGRREGGGRDGGREGGRRDARAARGAGGERLAPPAPARGGERPHGGYKRRVVTMDRPRNEHNRPIAVTVQRMYFGDWSVDNLREDEPQGQGGGRAPSGGGRGGRGGAPNGRGASPRGRGDRTAERGAAPQASRAPAQTAPAPAATETSGEGGEGRNRRRRRRRRGKNGGGEG